MTGEYSETFNISAVVAGKFHHSTPARRGATRYSDITPQEIKDIVVKYAGGSPAIMKRMSGVNSAYIVRAIRAQINVSWKKADQIRSVVKEISTMQTTATEPSTKSPNLESFHPSMQGAVTALIAKGKIVECSHCHDYFMRDVQHRSYCPNCKKAGNTTPKPVAGLVAPVESPAPKKSAKKSANRDAPIHRRPLIDCGNVECGRRLRDWAGRKYCSKPCRTRADYLRQVQRQGQTPTAPAATKAPQAPVTAPVAPSTAKVGTKHDGRLKGSYVSFAGAPCHREGCGGTMANRRGPHGVFFGCSWYDKAERPQGVDTCRATALWASNVDGRTLYGRSTPGASTPPAVQSGDSMVTLLLKEMRGISADLRDAVGRIADLESNITQIKSQVGEIHQGLI